VGAFGESRFEILTAFLAFVRTAHFWTETHPTLEYETDMLAVMGQHDDLAKLLLDRTEAERAKASVALRRTLAELQESRGERARAEEALRISEARLQAVLSAARMAYWEWDFATDTVTASGRDDLFGLAAGERFQANSRGFDLVLPDDQRVYRENVADAAREGGTWHHTFRVIRPRDGRVVWLEEHAHAAPDTATGKLSMAGLVWDVTERKNLELSLQDADHGHELIIESGTEELWVEGDVDRLTQIFSNLLTNAAKYTERGGRIELQVAREAEWAVVSVADNGIGIPSADLPRIFELFSQVRLHQGHSEGGLGIGLSIVRKLVEMHHGTVSVASEGSGHGSTFTVRLPLIRTMPESPFPDAAAA
jgi:PAS domain S-box-containing protein